MVPIHNELSQLAKAMPAGYISTTAFAKVTLDRLLQVVSLMKGKEIPAGAGLLSGSLADVVWSGTPGAVLAPPRNPIFPDAEVDVALSADFVVVIAIFIAGDPAKSISNVRLSVSQARTHLRAENNALVLEGADFDSKRTITRLPGADALLAAAGIDPLEAARIEGHVGYGVASQAVTAALAERYEIDLATMFPAVDFGKSIALRILSGGTALGVVPTDAASLRTSAHCTCKDGPDFQVSKTESTKTTAPNPGPNDEAGKIALGGPVPENKDPLKDFGPRYANRAGLAGLYIPQAFAEALTIEAMPALKVTASDHGTIGFRAEATVGFKNLRVTFDQPGGGILLDIDLDVSVSAYCDLELFKGLRLPIGWALVSPAPGSKASVQLAFYPAVNGTTVGLKGTLTDADMGHYVAVIIGVGTALKILGVTAWIGFLVDVVLSAVVSNGLPYALRKAIGDHLTKSEWQLIQGALVAPRSARWFPAAPFDMGPSSLLASFELDG